MAMSLTNGNRPLDFKYIVIKAITVIPLTNILANTYHPNKVLRTSEDQHS